MITEMLRPADGSSIERFCQMLARYAVLGVKFKEVTADQRSLRWVKQSDSLAFEHCKFGLAVEDEEDDRERGKKRMQLLAIAYDDGS
jgi:hypothetical protein